MKDLFVFFTASLLIAACAQNKNLKGGIEMLNAKYVKMISDTNVMMLIENAEVAYGDLYAKADSVLFDKPRQTITVYGARNATFKGEAIPGKGSIRYTKGAALYHIE